MVERSGGSDGLWRSLAESQCRWRTGRAMPDCGILQNATEYIELQRRKRMAAGSRHSDNVEMYGCGGVAVGQWR